MCSILLNIFIWIIAAEAKKPSGPHSRNHTTVFLSGACYTIRFLLLIKKFLLAVNRNTKKLTEKAIPETGADYSEVSSKQLKWIKLSYVLGF